MAIRDIVRNIANGNLNDAKAEIRNELNNRSYEKIQEMKPEVMKNAFKVPETPEPEAEE